MSPNTMCLDTIYGPHTSIMCPHTTMRVLILVDKGATLYGALSRCRSLSVSSLSLSRSCSLARSLACSVSCSLALSLSLPVPPLPLSTYIYLPFSSLLSLPLTLARALSLRCSLSSRSLFSLFPLALALWHLVTLVLMDMDSGVD